jgi:hypothetical protein
VVRLVAKSRESISTETNELSLHNMVTELANDPKSGYDRLRKLQALKNELGEVCVVSWVGGHIYCLSKIETCVLLSFSFNLLFFS